MTNKELDEKLLNQAVMESRLWLVKIPKLLSAEVNDIILDRVVSKFREHQIRLWKFKFFEVADFEFVVTANEAEEVMLIERKEEENG